MRVRVFYHDHCFDGAASAAFFSRFLEGAFYSDAEFVFTGLAHRASQLFDESRRGNWFVAGMPVKYIDKPRFHQFHACHCNL